MKNKKVFVTGSSRGIGFSVAEKFGGLGAEVIINCSKSDDELFSAAEKLRGKGINVIPIMGDVSDFDVCKSIFSEIKEKTGDIDILVNNAAVAYYGLFTDMMPDDWRRLTEINQFSVYNCCRLALPQMIKKRSGRIINISSVWGSDGASCEVIYSATKGAVDAFTKALAKEVAPSEIFVNGIACGVIDTKMNDNLSAEEKKELAQDIGLGRFGKAEDVAELAAFLVETNYMTGQILRLDGIFG